MKKNKIVNKIGILVLAVTAFCGNIPHSIDSANKPVSTCLHLFFTFDFMINLISTHISFSLHPLRQNAG